MASFERYQAVVYPFKKVGLQKRSVLLVITSWLLALTLGVISALFFIDSSLYVPCSFLDGAPNWAEYDQYLIFPLGMALLCVIIVLYSLILRTLFKHSVKMARHKRKRKIVPDTVKVNDADASASYTGQNPDNRGSTGSSQIFAVSFRSVKDAKDSPKINNTSASITLNVPVTISTSTNKTVQTTVHEQTTTDKNIATSSIHDNTIEIVGMDGSVHMTKTNDDNVSGAVCLMSKKNRENGRRRVELKASRKIAILVGTFTCCWIPLPVFVISNSISGSTMLSYSMFCVLIVLGTLGSSVIAINPVLYALLNRPLNSALKNLLNLNRNLCGWKSS
ncbi:Octopamine receptor [Mizuhopecten yessoensis]|uniref:Octopamine receptor n=2 Tax=Mizuhopecten yessoensis TaxID=6573 RepID=A0A210PDW9_MIZYE|nr:Octopamine receptor [Mizuhopecten yessoensis]